MRLSAALILLLVLTGTLQAEEIRGKVVSIADAIRSPCSTPKTSSTRFVSKESTL